ncbi:MAG TPA: hypothetical protein VFQ39_17900 [Longimicrobium sp.]|nr:hypothetical protein [Longimicrobium sp.]
MKLEDIKVESFSTDDGAAAMLPPETWNDATAGCCSPPPFTASLTCTCVRGCL